MIWEALYRPVQEPKKEMIYNAPQSHMFLLKKAVNIVAFQKKNARGTSVG